MNAQLNEYDRKISQFADTLSHNINLYETTIKVNECVKLYVTMRTDLNNHIIPSLQEKSKIREMERLKLYKKKCTPCAEELLKG